MTSDDHSTRKSKRATHPPLFLSYDSADLKLATLFAHFLSTALWDCPSGQISKSIFFTGDSGHGLRPGEQDFNLIIKNALGAKAVVALITPESLKSTAVIAEMAVAQAKGKLIPVVVRGGYADQLTWPFRSTEACKLDEACKLENAHSTNSLLNSVRDKLKMPAFAQEGPAVAAQCEKLGRVALEYPAPTPRVPDRQARSWRTWSLLAALCVLVAASTVAIMRILTPAPTEIVATEGRRVKIEAHEYEVLFVTDFPRKRLSDKLQALSKSLPESERRNAGQYFIAALTDYMQSLKQSYRPRTADDDLTRLIKLVNDWRPEISSAESAPVDAIEVPERRIDPPEKPEDAPRSPLTSTRPPVPSRCSDLTGLDRAWCIELDNVVKAATRKIDVGKAIDDAKFAVVADTWNEQRTIKVLRDGAPVGKGSKYRAEIQLDQKTGNGTVRFHSHT